MRILSIVLSAGLALSQAGPASGFGRDVVARDSAFRFVVLNDVHMTVADLPGSRAQLRRVVDEVNGFASEIAFVLVAGDLGQASGIVDLTTELEAAKQELDRLRVPYHAALGNHDVTTTGDDSAFRSRFGSPHKYFKHGGVHFIAFQTAVTRMSTTIPLAALDSLQRSLGSVGVGEPVVVFAHHPLGPITPFGVTNRQAFYDRIDAYRLEAVFNGHYHGVFEEQRNGTWYCTTRAASEHRCNHDGNTDKGYRVSSVWPDGTLSSMYFQLGSPPDFAPARPTWNATGGRLAAVGRALQLRLEARDPQGEALTYAATGLPAGASFDAASRLFTWTPTAAQSGWHPDIVFRANNSWSTDTLRLGVRVVDEVCVHEDFESAIPGWTSAGGSWSLQGGELVQSLANSGAYTFASSTELGDFYLEADLVHDAGVGYAGLVFRYLDPNNYYYVWNNSSQIEVRRRVNGIAYRLGEPVPVGPIAGWHHVRVEALGTVFKVYWDGEQRFEVQDATFASGAVGLVCSQASARFDNVLAIGCATLPNRPPVLQPLGSRTAFVGAPFVLELQATDADAQPLVYDADGLPPGAQFDASLRRLTWTPGSTDVGIWRGLVLRASDGELSDAESITLTVLDTTRACLFEDFSEATANQKWSPASGSWGVSTGSYVGESPGVGTSLHATGALTNFSYQARVRVEGTGYGNLVFRATDATHYYYLYTTSNSNTLELRKQQGSNATVLARGGEICGSIPGQWHLYRIETHNETIRVWVDGERRFEVRDIDSPYTSGRVGLRVSNATVRFDDVLVFDCEAATVDAAVPMGPPLRRLTSHPNPFNPQTTASFDLAAETDATLEIFAASGRCIRQLFAGHLEAGAHHVVWDARDDAGRRVASGTYYLRVQAGRQVESRSLVLLK